MVLSTCNRMDIYAGVSDCCPALAQITGVLCGHTGADPGTLARHRHVRADDEAVGHVYRVAAGLD